MPLDFFPPPTITPKDAEWNVRVAERLSDIRETYPLEEKFAIWVYAVLSSDANVTQSSKTDLINLPNYLLKKEYEIYSAIHTAISTEGIGENTQEWVNLHIRYTKPDTRIHNKLRDPRYCLKISGGHIFPVASRKYPNERAPYEKTYGIYQRIAKFLPTYRKMSLSNVDNFITTHLSQEKGPTPALTEVPLNITVPEVDQAAITAKAQTLKRNSAADLTGYGTDVSIAAADAVTKLSGYFIQRAARPSHTLDLVEGILQEALATKKTPPIKDDPTWFRRTFSRPQLVSPDQMPLAELVRKAAELPRMAAIDNDALGQNLEIADHAMAVLNAYYQIIKGHKEALENEKERLLNPGEQQDILSQLTTTRIADTIERTLQRLSEDMTFMQIFAGNFWEISSLTAESRQKLAGIAHLAALIQTPAMHAIAELQAHQLRRFTQLGGVISDQITAEFGAVSQDARKLDRATPEHTRHEMGIALTAVISRLESLPQSLITPTNKAGELAQDMQDLLAENYVRLPG